MAYLTSADTAAEIPAEQETTSVPADKEEPAELALDETDAVATAEQVAEAPAESDELADDQEIATTAENTETAGDETEIVTAAENADDAPEAESSEPTLDDDEMAYLTSADNAAEISTEQETTSELADKEEPAELALDETDAIATAEQVAETPAESDELADDQEIAPTAETAETAGDDPEIVTAAENADDAPEAEATEPTLDDDEMAYLTSADTAAEVSTEQETEISADLPSVAPVADGFAGAPSDITDDDLDDLIDVPILPLPAESTEVTDDDLASIHAPILSPGDPVSIPSLTAQADPAVPPAELSSPSIVEIVQEQEAIETLGNLTAPKVTDPLTLFKKLRDLAEELPHNVYYAFKASRMCAMLDEIIADFEA